MELGWCRVRGPPSTERKLGNGEKRKDAAEYRLGRVGGEGAVQQASQKPTAGQKPPVPTHPGCPALLSCQMKSRRLTATVSPVKLDTSRTPPLPPPAASPTQGECAWFAFFPPSQHQPMTVHLMLSSTDQLHSQPGASLSWALSSTGVRTRASWRKPRAPPSLIPAAEIHKSPPTCQVRAQGHGEGHLGTCLNSTHLKKTGK